MTQFQQAIETAQPVAAVIISVALMLFSGFLMTRITKLLRLPNVTAYIVAGILIGPYCLDLVPQRIISGTDFLSDIALAFIAFSTGEFFKLSVLKKSGMKVVWITLFEAVLASVFVFRVPARAGVFHRAGSAGLGDGARLDDDDHSPDRREG